MAHASPQPLLQHGDNSMDRFLRSLLLKDSLFTPIFVAWYFVLALPLDQHGILGPVGRPPAAVMALQGALAVAGCVTFGKHLATPPPPPEEADMRALMVFSGRWVFLTRHCITLQAIHLIVSFTGAVSCAPQLLRFTEGIAVFIGALGWFVTMQFFLLVFNHPEFKAKCRAAIEEDPQNNMRRRAALIHTPPLLLALLDITFAKPHTAMRHNCSLPGTLELTAAYTVFYVALLVLNHAATGQWPYPFMKAFTLRRWAAFLCSQVLILAVLCLINWGISLIPVG